MFAGPKTEVRVKSGDKGAHFRTSQCQVGVRVERRVEGDGFEGVDEGQRSWGRGMAVGEDAEHGGETVLPDKSRRVSRVGGEGGQLSPEGDNSRLLGQGERRTRDRKGRQMNDIRGKPRGGVHTVWVESWATKTASRALACSEEAARIQTSFQKAGRSVIGLAWTWPEPDCSFIRPRVTFTHASDRWLWAMLDAKVLRISMLSISGMKGICPCSTPGGEGCG